MSQITFIGAGNMSQAIIRGLLASGYNPQDITATRRNLSKLQELHQTMQINITDDNTRAVHNADIIVLGVKPQDMQATCQSIALALANNKQRPIIISIAAGIILQSLTSWLNYNATIVRTMPNTPAMVGCGITGIFSKNINEIQKQLVDVIFCSVGSTIWVETEEQINIINAISGSGPAYYYYFTEGLTQAGINLGLSRVDAQKMAIATAYGASKMMHINSEVPPGQLRRNVTSPNGTTQKAIEKFEELDLHNIINQAVISCKIRAEELTTQLNNI